MRAGRSVTLGFSNPRDFNQIPLIAKAGARSVTSNNLQGQNGMLTGAIRTQIDQIWNAFWSGGVSNPLSVIEQLTFLMFIKRLDDLHTLEERKAEDLRQPMQ